MIDFEDNDLIKNIKVGIGLIKVIELSNEEGLGKMMIRLEMINVGVDEINDRCELWLILECDFGKVLG